MRNNVKIMKRVCFMRCGTYARYTIYENFGCLFIYGFLFYRVESEPCFAWLVFYVLLILSSIYF